MYLRYYFRAQAIAGTIYGVGLLFFPVFTLHLHGLSPTPSAVYFASMLGGIMTGTGYTTWLVRDAEISKPRQAFLTGLFIQNCVVMFWTTNALINELINEWAWLIIALCIVFTTWNFYYIVVREDNPSFDPAFLDDE